MRREELEIVRDCVSQYSDMREKQDARRAEHLYLILRELCETAISLCVWWCGGNRRKVLRRG